MIIFESDGKKLLKFNKIKKTGRFVHFIIIKYLLTEFHPKFLNESNDTVRLG